MNESTARALAKQVIGNYTSDAKIGADKKPLNVAAKEQKVLESIVTYKPSSSKWFATDSHMGMDEARKAYSQVKGWLVDAGFKNPTPEQIGSIIKMYMPELEGVFTDYNKVKTYINALKQKGTANSINK
jgi:hypothetical protein